VFTRTKHRADLVVRRLVAEGIDAAAIHGNKSQNNRDRALADFRDGRIRILVATDIAARGIDVDRISHVVNFDLPHVAETYVHRIGRTGRAGALGTAISLCDTEEAALLRDIEKLIRKSIAASGRQSPLPQPRQVPPEGKGQRGRAPRSRKWPEPTREARQVRQTAGPQGIAAVAFLNRGDDADQRAHRGAGGSAIRFGVPL
jgi:ATP-dependent RNA helicase RhlE